MATISTDQLIAQTGTIDRGPMVQQIVPELMIKAADIIAAVDQIIAKYPDRTTDLLRLRDLKLNIARETYICDQIKDRCQRRVRVVNKEVLAWSKDKTFGPLLDNNLKLDRTRGRRLLKQWGEQRMRQAIDDYNEQLVPYQNSLLGSTGTWSAEERERHGKLNDMIREHNDLSNRLRPFIK